jgi:methylglutaconyl-CoA hydratase
MKNSAQSSQTENLEDARSLGRLFYQIANCSVPVVSVVQGAAFGGGFGLASCTDFILAEQNAQFCLSEVSIGLVPGVISPYIVRKLGLSFATSAMLTAKRISGQQLFEKGIAEATFNAQNGETAENGEADTAQKALLQILTQLLKNGPNAMRRTKLLLKKCSPLPSTDVFEYTVQNIAQARMGEEAKEGLNLVLNKTKPSWGVFL